MCLVVRELGNRKKERKNERQCVYICLHFKRVRVKRKRGRDGEKKRKERERERKRERDIF